MVLRLRFQAVRIRCSRYAALKSFVVFENGAPGVLEVVGVRRHQDVYLFCFQGYPDRTAAERLRSVDLYVSREVLEAPAEGEYYYSDLKGLSVLVSGSQESFGSVTEVFDTGANTVITVAYRDGERDRLINVPFIDEAIDEVSIAGGFISVKEMFLRT